MDEFFVVRKFHDQQMPMEKLWRQAQNEDDGLVVPMAKHR